MRFIKHTLSLIIASTIFFSCLQKQNGDSYKNNCGLFICKVTTPEGSEVSCNSEVEFKTPAPFTIASYGKQTDGSDFPENTVYLYNAKHSCSESIDFFPISLLTIKSQSAEKKIVIGLPVSPKLNNKEITDFFKFQIEYGKQLITTSNWIEHNYDRSWLVTGWKDEKAARTHLERIIRGF